MKEKTSPRKIFVLARKLFKRVKNIKASEFYRLTHKPNMDKDILPTNILTHDRTYAYCYRFYLDNYKKAQDEDLHKLDIYYHNFFLSLLIKFLAEYKIGNTKISKQAKFIFDKNEKLTFDKLSFKKGMFAFEIKPDLENLGIIIEVKLINNAVRSDTKVDLEKFASYYILTTFTYSEANQPLIDSILKEKREIYTDVILATQNNTILDFLNVVNISSYDNDSDQLIRNLIASFTMLFVTDVEIYEDKCPVCGKKQASINNKEYLCQACHSKYSLLNINDKEMMWIKSFRRKEKW